MKSFYYISAFVCLASWTNYASAFVIPTTKGCRGVSCRAAATVVGMTDNSANEEENSTFVEETAAPEAVLQSSNDEETEVTDTAVDEETEEAPSEEQTTTEAALDSSTEEETEVTAETQEDPVEEETVVEPVLESSTDEEAKAPKSDEAEVKKEIPWMELFGAAADLAGALGDVAAKAAASALEDFTPKEVTDVSIPYDAASAQAYSEWLAKSNKEDPELERYDYFKKNYRTVTVSNVIAKKMIRDGIPEGENPPELLKFNQYADLSTEEYLEVQKSLQPKSWGDLFGELASAAMDMASSTTSSEAKTKVKAAPASKKKVPAKKASVKKTPVRKTTVKKVTVKKTSAKKEPATDSGFTFFGLGTKSVKKPPQANAKKQPPRRALQKAAPAKKKAPIKVAGVPVLSRWKQNKDGSLTGFVSNSASYKTGTRITTSPVPKDAKGGMVVRTGSGSRYKLN